MRYISKTMAKPVSSLDFCFLGMLSIRSPLAGPGKRTVSTGRIDGDRVSGYGSTGSC
jgi:hypothetical protein